MRPAILRYVAIGVLAALWLGASGAMARDFIVAPIAEVPENLRAAADGSAGAPFHSVWAALESGAVKGGDRIVMRDGHHSGLQLVNRSFDPPLEIVSENPGGAHVERIHVRGSKGLRISGLSVWPLEASEKDRGLVGTNGNATDIRFANLDIRGREDAPETYMDWSKQEWRRGWRSNGVALRGPDNAILDSKITGVAFGITTYGPRAEVRGNIIEGFSGDAMRGLGNGSVFSGNRIANCFKVDGNHDDGFQSWAREGDGKGRKVVSDIVIENNIILEWIGPEKHPLRCTLQGMGLFDGDFRNFTIRNNLIAINAWHGISIYGGIDSQIANNTVVHINGSARDRPWIMVNAHKDGTRPRGIQVINNVAVTYKGISEATRRNGVVKYPARLFRDAAHLDFRLSPSSPLVNAGTTDGAPTTDLLGLPRDAQPDLGAFELH